MICQCCKAQKARLQRVPSKLVKGMDSMLCSECRNKGMEPRHVVVLAAASGIDVREFVVKRLYCGAELSARDVMH